MGKLIGVGVWLMVTITGAGRAWAEPLSSLSLDDVRWQIVNDTVMGGKSWSQLTPSQDALIFSGYLNTNGGGFASVRSQRLEVDLAAAVTLRLRVRGDGREYAIRLYTAGERASYQHRFRTLAGEWQWVNVRLSDFDATWRGRRLDRPPLIAGDIVALGLILADGIDGNFAVELDQLEFLAEPAGRGGWSEVL